MEEVIEIGGEEGAQGRPRVLLVGDAIPSRLSDHLLYASMSRMRSLLTCPKAL
jgi:hypothetical protein